jgi:hypothetical protein
MPCGGHVLLCGICMDARGVGEDELVAGARRQGIGVLTKFRCGVRPLFRCGVMS